MSQGNDALEGWGGVIPDRGRVLRRSRVDMPVQPVEMMNAAFYDYAFMTEILYTDAFVLTFTIHTR